jgi:ribosomal protein S20
MEFKNAMTAWVDLKQQLTAARKDVGILNKREKELRTFIKTYMHDEEIDVANVDKHKVKYVVRTAKGTVTRAVIKNGLHNYFGGDEARIEGAYQAILDAAPEVKRDSLSLT